MNLSEKELLMIGECAIGHMSAIEKFRYYSQACTDQEMKQLIDSHINRMEQHRQNFVNLVQGGTQQYGGQYGVVPQAQGQGRYQQQY